MTTTELGDLVAAAQAGLAGDAQAALERARERAEAGATADASDGRIRVVLGGDGRIRSLTIDPAVLRDPLDDILVAVTGAINAAHQELAGNVDVSPAVQVLQAIREETRAELQALLAGFDAAESTVTDLRRTS